MAINNLFTFQAGDFDLLVEDGGTYRISTGAASLSLGALQGKIGGNYNLATNRGTPLAVVSGAPDGNPSGSNQLFAYDGRTVNVCNLAGGIVTLLPNPGT